VVNYVQKGFIRSFPERQSEWHHEHDKERKEEGSSCRLDDPENAKTPCLTDSVEVEFPGSYLKEVKRHLWRHDTQHNDTQHNDIQHNDIQHNETQHNDTQHNIKMIAHSALRQSA
jgi:hypothetical protein